MAPEGFGEFFLATADTGGAFMWDTGTSDCDYSRVIGPTFPAHTRDDLAGPAARVVLGETMASWLHMI